MWIFNWTFFKSETLNHPYLILECPFDFLKPICLISQNLIFGLQHYFELAVVHELLYLLLSKVFPAFFLDLLREGLLKLFFCFIQL